MLTCLTHNDDVGYNLLCWLNQDSTNEKNDSLRMLLNRGSRSNLHMPLNATLDCEEELLNSKAAQTCK